MRNPVRTYLRVLYLLIITFLSGVLYADEILEGSWKSCNGPTGGQVNAMGIAVSNTKILYAATGAGIYKTEDGAKTWRKAGAKSSHRGQGNLTVHPQRPEVLVLAQNGIEISRDGGETWEKMNPPGGGQGYFSDTVFATDEKASLYVASGSKLFRTEDLGENWSEIFELKGQGNFLLEVDAKHPECLFVRIMYQAKEVHFTTDAGKTWSSFEIPPEKQVRGIGIHPSDPKTILYVDETGACFFSTDKGKTWEVFYHPYDRAYDTKEILEIVRSIFPKLPASPHRYYQMRKEHIIEPDNPDVVYHAPMSGGIQKTTDGGRTWTDVQNGLIATEVVRLWGTKDIADKVFCSTSGDVNILDTGDNKWSRLDIPSVSWYYIQGGYAFALDPAKPSRYVAGDQLGRVLISEDSGKNWVQYAHFELPQGMNRVLGFSFLPDEKDTFLAYSMSGVYKCNAVTGITNRHIEYPSEDEQQVWGLLAVFNPESPERLFLDHTQWKNTSKYTADAGAIWKDIKREFAFQPNMTSWWAMGKDGTVWAIGDNKIHALDPDKGEWRTLTSPKVSGFASPTSISVSPSSDKRIYLSDAQKRVWISEDAGETWKSLGSPGDDVTVIFEHPADGKIYAGTRNSGVMVFSKD